MAKGPVVAVRSVTSTIGIEVQRVRISVSRFVRAARKCKIVTKAMPQSAGR